MTSLTERTLTPALLSVRMAESRPEPMPLEKTLTSFTPNPCAFCTRFSVTCEAAYGVDFFGPLNPMCPALDHASAFPFMSVSVIIVLLNEAWMCTCACVICRATFFFFLVDVAFAIVKTISSPQYAFRSRPFYARCRAPFDCSFWCVDRAKGVAFYDALRGRHQCPSNA